MSSIIKVDTIQKADGTAGTIENLGLATGALSHRNLIINGAMNVAQRGTSSGASAGNGYHACDRMKLEESGDGGITVSQVADAPHGFVYSHKFTLDTAYSSIASSNYCQTYYAIEANDWAQTEFGTSVAKDLSLSFWVKASQTGVYPVTLSNSSGVRHYPMSYTVNSANTWEKKTLSISGDTGYVWNLSGTGSTGAIRFGQFYGSEYNGATADSWMSASGYANAFVTQTNNFSSTTNATWQITGIQLELGSVATPFEYRSYGEELERCQRYYYTTQSVFSADGTNGFCFNLQFPTTMRASPTVSYSYGGVAGDLYKLSDASTPSFSSPNGLFKDVNGIRSGYKFGTSFTKGDSYSTIWVMDAEI